MYQLLIVDDEPLVQAGIRSMLNWTELDVEICGTAMNGQAALKIIEEKSPDIVITDIKMPVMTGLELTKICRERFGKNHPQFIILTSYEDFHMAKEALTYQVSDYLVKLELTPDTLREAVEKVIKQIRETEGSTKPSPVSVHPFNDKFFISLLHNLFESEEQFLLQSRDLNLNFDYAGYVCCYGEIISATADTLPTEKQLLLFTSSLQMIKELVIKYMPVYALSLDMRHFALIFCYKLPANAGSPSTGNITEQYFIEIQNILQSMSSTLQNYYNVSLRCGIGSLVDTPQAICDSYQYSRQAYLTVTEECPFPFFEHVIQQESPRTSFNISLFKGDLTKAFEEYDPDILEQTILAICELFQAHPNHYVQALDAACNILYLSISLLQNGEAIVSEFFADSPDGYRSIYKQANVEQVISWLHYFTEQLSEVFRNRRKDYKNHIVTNVKKYIHEHIREHLSLNEVAAVFGISPSYLSQLFSKYNETGFSEYINISKINEAKRLLDEENLKVYEVAEMLGFESAFYFSKVFKKVEGVSPTEYMNGKYV
ncbi:MAG: response regulator [Lachnospiraceae bacterium]|nr:response regulator [Lachnospiraceae bacterium]